ncbi:Protein of unknown function [Cotesia congregata]|uniref:Uncharacterized protein n=1 Tax=Cotesia congregata TaxID=51543 RepID=A0A8J2HPM2_COTCN|nr:Protein of unknown function [Cotesia congregata]
MPGIHVRTPDKFDWFYREKEPILTVPGSYWLCHKKSIYKFTFKYHRQSKDNKQFNYGKDLMKVIRRIIKSQPRQGQQFGTQHLLVTYNHSSWTRQDKMFAMLKFREKTSATAFSRAFILTVKIVSTNLNYKNETKLDDDLVEYNTDKKPNKWSEIIKKQNSEESINTSQNIQSASITFKQEEICNNSPKCQITNFDDISDSVKIPFSSSVNSNSCIEKSSASFLPELKESPFIEECISKLQDLSKTEHTINDKAESFNEVQESVDMPYQYLIEREIERTNLKGTGNPNVQSLIPKNVPEKPTRDSRNESAVFRAKSVSTSNIIDNATARSANITDLVMEGLMFTITQNQDSIKVFEQKTKSEPDEVLENSEKAETLEGSKHLINSSLFKLENLITKIEMSNSPQIQSEHEKDNKTTFLSSIFRKNDLRKQERTKKSYIEINGNNDKDNIGIVLLSNKNKEKSTEKILESKPYRLSMDSSKTEDPKIPLLEYSSDSTENIHDNILKQFKNKNSLDSKPIIKKNMLPEHISKNVPIEPSKNKSEKDKNVNLNFNIYNNNNNNVNINVDNWNVNDDEEEIIPEALQNHQSICSEIHNNSASSTQVHESHLLMDDIESERGSYSLNNSKLINKLHVPRVISNEAVKYDLSSLRTPIVSELNSNASTPIVNTKIECQDKLGSCLHQNEHQSCERVINSTRKKLIARRRLYIEKSNTDKKETAIEMWKFLQDITHGVKIVLQRLSY